MVAVTASKEHNLFWTIIVQTCHAFISFTWNPDKAVFKETLQKRSAIHLNEIFGENVLMTHILYLAKGNGDVLYHSPEKRFVPYENHVKWSIFSSTCNCGQMVQTFPGILVKARKREYLKRYYLSSRKHSTKMNRSINFKTSWKYQQFHSNGKCSSTDNCS